MNSGFNLYEMNIRDSLLSNHDIRMSLPVFLELPMIIPIFNYIVFEYPTRQLNKLNFTTSQPIN
jgi:hypothetical protein